MDSIVSGSPDYEDRPMHSSFLRERGCFSKIVRIYHGWIDDHSHHYTVILRKVQDPEDCDESVERRRRHFGDRFASEAVTTEMVFDDLNAALNWTAEDPPWHGLVLIKDAAATCEGTLLLHHFISLHLRAERNVCLVGFEQNLQHYATVSRRFGVNLQTAAEAGRFTFVDAFSNPFSNEALSRKDAEKNSSEGKLEFSISPKNLRGSVQQFVQLVSKLVNARAGEANGPGPCVIIDSLSTFVDACPEGEHAAVLDLVQYLRVLSKDRSLRCSVVCLVQAPPSPLTPLHKAVLSAEYMADLIMEVSPLASGFSSAVHGQLLVRPGAQNLNVNLRSTGNLKVGPGRATETHQSLGEEGKLLHFKAKDSTVSFFPPGLFKT